VQGVGFRWFVREHAESLALAGWVRNTNDGAVEIAARGLSDALVALEAHARRGPGGARVEAVDRVAPPGSTDYPEPFIIAR